MEPSCRVISTVAPIDGFSSLIVDEVSLREGEATVAILGNVEPDIEDKGPDVTKESKASSTVFNR
jgi:hypothetical protein